MLGITQTQLLDQALLMRYAIDGSHTDCYSCHIEKEINLEEFITAFYTTPLFKLERLILRLVDKPSSELDVANLAANKTESFAAWTVEAREENQILLRDYQGKTRSWLMISEEENGTSLYFGSAVIVKNNSGEIGRGFKLLMGFHKLYSVLLLYFARRSLS